MDEFGIYLLVGALILFFILIKSRFDKIDGKEVWVVLATTADNKRERLVFEAVRAAVPMLQQDRPPGPDAMRVHGELFSSSLHDALRAVAQPAP